MENEVAIRPVDTLISSAVEKNIDVDKLERLIEMRNNELARIAKEEYDRHFAQMQQDYVPVGKNKEAKDRDGRKVLYKYCPLDTILKVYQPIISKHGFSYRWSEESLSATEKRIWCVVSGYGHEERSYVDIPVPSATAFTNAIQQRGSATTYGKRYSFIGAFGVVIDEEDDDATGVPQDPPPSRRGNDHSNPATAKPADPDQKKIFKQFNEDLSEIAKMVILEDENKVRWFSEEEKAQIAAEVSAVTKMPNDDPEAKAAAMHTKYEMVKHALELKQQAAAALDADLDEAADEGFNQHELEM